MSELDDQPAGGSGVGGPDQPPEVAGADTLSPASVTSGQSAPPPPPDTTPPIDRPAPWVLGRAAMPPPTAALRTLGATGATTTGPIRPIRSTRATDRRRSRHLRHALLAGLVGGLVGALVAAGAYVAVDDDRTTTAAPVPPAR